MKHSELTGIASQAEVNEAIQQLFNDKTSVILYKYGITRLKGFFNIQYDEEKGLNGFTLHDLIQETTESFIVPGRRHWYKDKFPCFKDQYFSAFDSVISNEVNKMKKFKFELQFIEDLDSDKLVADDNYQEHYDILIEELKKLNASDDEILLFDAIYIDGMKRQQAGIELNKTVEEITDIRKRLDRKLAKIRLIWNPDNDYE